MVQDHSASSSLDYVFPRRSLAGGEAADILLAASIPQKRDQGIPYVFRDVDEFPGAFFRLEKTPGDQSPVPEGFCSGDGVKMGFFALEFSRTDLANLAKLPGEAIQNWPASISSARCRATARL